MNPPPPLGPLVLCCGFLAGASAAAEAPADASSPPNVVLLLADDLGWAGVGYAGAMPFLKTPHLDEMARGGVRFDRFYAAAPWCSPTRVSCLTRRCPARYDSRTPGDGLPDEAVTVAEILKSRGYRTAPFGKWHLGRPEPRGQGYDDSLWTGDNAGHVDPTYVDHDGGRRKLAGEDCEILVDRWTFCDGTGIAGRRRS